LFIGAGVAAFAAPELLAMEVTLRWTSIPYKRRVVGMLELLLTGTFTQKVFSGNNLSE